MKPYSKLSKILPVVRWILAFIGFAVIVFSGKMTHHIFHWKYNSISLVILSAVGLLLMTPLVSYIIKERMKD